MHHQFAGMLSRRNPSAINNLWPGVQHNLLSQRGGLVVVCGATDAGKTVTCTSLINSGGK